MVDPVSWLAMNKAGLSLHIRLMASIVFALAVGLGLDGALLVWQARHSVASEIDAAFTVGRQTIAAVLESLPASPAPALDLQRLITVFDGNRHIRVALLGAGPEPLAQSTLAPASAAAPHWFVALIGVPPQSERIALPARAAPVEAIRLETDSRNEELEVWNALRETAGLIVVLVLSSGLLIWWSVTHVLRPLSMLSAALRSVGAGEFEARLPSGGLPEAQVIAAAFNRMAEDLSAARERNRALYRQLLSAQEAERKDLARDLHDDIGPLLLAVSIDAAAVEHGIAGLVPEATPTLHAIGQTIRQAQQHIRAIVNRLRPIGLAEFGLRRAVENLVVFWQRRHPEVAFTLDLGDGFEPPGELAQVTVFRIVQEALSNALRHGAPSGIRVTFRPGPDDAFRVEVSDDGKGAAEAKPGFGLTGMQERVEAAGGRLVTVSEPGIGFTVTAILPRRAGAEFVEPVS